jgi:putative tricarboxylic transport membrane protein
MKTAGAVRLAVPRGEPRGVAPMFVSIGQNFMNRVDHVSSMILLIVSIAIIAGSLSYALGTLSSPGPGFLPLACGLIMAGLSLVVFVQAVSKGKKETGREGEAFWTSRWPKLAAALIILLAYSFLLETLGYVLMTFVFLLFVLKVVEPTPWGSALLESVLATGISYAVLELWLKVPLPRGFFPKFF